MNTLAVIVEVILQQKSSSLPPPDATNQISSVPIPDWAKQPSQDLALPSSSSHTQPPQDSALSLPSFPAPPAAPPPSPPLTILFRQNGDQIINVHGAPPEEEKKWYLEVIRTIHPPEQSGSPIPLQFPAPQFVRRQQSLTDFDRPSTRSALPMLHLPDSSGQLSDSTTDADQPSSIITNTGTSQYEVHVRPDGFSTVGNDAQQIQVRFLTELEYKHITLQKSSTWVSWARMSIVEYKHHQCNEPGMQHIWCPTPCCWLLCNHCWLLCNQFLQTCKKQSAKDDFWFRLWHFFDHFKDVANRSTNRLSAAHEINLTCAIHHTVLDDNLRQMMRSKIVTGAHYPDVPNWTVQLRVLERILANWNEWQDTSHWIIPHVEAGTEILMIFYTSGKHRPNHTPTIVMKSRQCKQFLGDMPPLLKVVSKLSTLVAYGPQQQSMSLAAPTIGAHPSIVVSTANLWIPRLTTTTTFPWQNRPSYIAGRKHQMNIVQLLFTALPMLVNVI